MGVPAEGTVITEYAPKRCDNCGFAHSQHTYSRREALKEEGGPSPATTSARRLSAWSTARRKVTGARTLRASERLSTAT